MNRIVFGTLRLRWARILLMGLSTAVAFTLLGFFFAIRHGFAVGFTQVAADLLLVEPAGGTTELPIALLSTVNAFPGVRSAAAIGSRTMRFGVDRRPVDVEGVSAPEFLAIPSMVGSGALGHAEAQTWITDLRGALVGAEAARKYGWRVGQTLTLHSVRGESLPDFTFQVDGVIAKTDGVTFSDDVNVHLRYFRQWAHTDSVAVILIQVRHATQADAIARALELKLANSATPVRAQSFKSLLEGMAERLADVNTLTFVIIAASLSGLFLICFNTTAHSIAERIGEFALLKAIGFTPPRLLWLVFFETFLAIVPAAAVGVLSALLAVRAFAGPKLNLPGITLTPAALVGTMIIAVGLAVLSSVLPGLRIMRLNCGEILRRG